MITVRNLSKTFILHNQGGVRIPVFDNLDLHVAAGECLALHGRSGAGKSTLLRSLYANYKPRAGTILVRHRDVDVDIVSAEPRQVLEIRRETIGYVSQFLRVIPRVSTLDIVMEPLLDRGESPGRARERAEGLLDRLNIPARLRDLAPMTFSGGEQQRVNIARGFAVMRPVLLLDEPTASLDGANREVVMELIEEAKAGGTAVVGIFHDDEVRSRVADRVFNMQAGERAA
jgi:alpha-D-ribose 1-methylphosphonate 5-triphosphate synthase subunit PhnL